MTFQISCNKCEKLVQRNCKNGNIKEPIYSSFQLFWVWSKYFCTLTWTDKNHVASTSLQQSESSGTYNICSTQPNLMLNFSIRNIWLDEITQYHLSLHNLKARHHFHKSHSHSQTPQGIHPVNDIQCFDTVNIEIENRNRWWPSCGVYLSFSFSCRRMVIALASSLILTQATSDSVKLLAFTDTWSNFPLCHITKHLLVFNG